MRIGDALAERLQWALDNMGESNRKIKRTKGVDIFVL